MATSKRGLHLAATNELHGVARIKAHEGKLDEVKHLLTICMQSVRARDSRTLQYDVYFNRDAGEFVLFERYRDSAALLEHNEHLGDTMSRLRAVASISSAVCGEPNTLLRTVLEGAGVRIYLPYLSL